MNSEETEVFVDFLDSMTALLADIDQKQSEWRDEGEELRCKMAGVFAPKIERMQSVMREVVNGDREFGVDVAKEILQLSSEFGEWLVDSGNDRYVEVGCNFLVNIEMLSCFLNSE